MYTSSQRWKWLLLVVNLEEIKDIVLEIPESDLKVLSMLLMESGPTGVMMLDLLILLKTDTLELLMLLEMEHFELLELGGTE